MSNARKTHRAFGIAAPAPIITAIEACPVCKSADVSTWGWTGERTDADEQDIYGCNACGYEQVLVTEREATGATT